MGYIEYSLISAVILGVYDLFKKESVKNNAVIPVLFFSIATGSILWFPATVLSPSGYLEGTFLNVEALDLRTHLEILGKSVIVAGSWILGYFGLRNLPVSLFGPIRSTSPLWTLIGALILFGESPNLQQWIGILVTLGFFICLSFAGKKEGIHFHRDPWIYSVIGATILAAASALYDRYLLGVREIDVSTVQAWFSHYLLLIFIPIMFGWYKRLWKRGTFEWRWSIPLIGVSLLIGDYFYFVAMSSPDALVSVVSSLRRGAIMIPFAAGYFIYKERNYRLKLPFVAGILAGIVIISLG